MRLPLVLSVCALGLLACAEGGGPLEPEARSHADDIATDDPRAFDADLLVEQAPFEDASAMSQDDVARFLARTPYKFASFLASNTSNGVSAAEAIHAAAQRYKLKPLVFLTYAEVAEGLIAQREFPYPPSRAVRVFGCDVDGFDRQVDCLGYRLRSGLQAIEASGTTPTGWGPGVERQTKDGVRVTPANAATAVLYDLQPVVGKSAPRGGWVFWNLFRKYSTFLRPAR